MIINLKFWCDNKLCFVKLLLMIVWCDLVSGLKLVTVDRPFAEKHYADLSAKPFFSGLVDYIISGPVVAMIWEGKNVVTTGRKIIGATNPAQSEPGTIRGDFAIDIGRYNRLVSSQSCSSSFQMFCFSCMIMCLFSFFKFLI